MQIHVNTDKNIKGSAELTRKVEDVVQSTLDWMSRRITRVEVFLRDVDGSGKSVGDDKRCLMEARLAGLQPISVSDDGPTLEQAYTGAASKLEKTLKRTLERLDDPKGRTSFAGNQT